MLGEIAAKRRGEWFRVKDLGRTDADGYFYHAGRADDVIISAGWTMSAVEIENSLLTHRAVLEAAAIGVPDAVRGQVGANRGLDVQRGDRSHRGAGPGRLISATKAGGRGNNPAPACLCFLRVDNPRGTGVPIHPKAAKAQPDQIAALRISSR